MGKAIKDIIKIATATVGSRILGLVRDAATMAYLSIGAVSAAYTFAFTLPNLFRRLLGEGALISALIPVLTKTLKEGGEPAAFAFLNKALTRTAILLTILMVFGIAVSAIALGFCDGNPESRFSLGAQYSIVLMPYMLLICIAAVFSAALNVMGSFGIPSIGPMLLNMAIICGLFGGVWAFGTDKVALGYSMCAAWIVGGFLQAALPAYWLRKRGWRYSFDTGKSDSLSELYKLFIPALVGAAVVQVNIFVSKILALFISDAALPSLYISSRILEFPLGVFAVAIATVYFPKLSALNAPEKREDFKKAYKNGLVGTMSITIPSTIGIALLSRDIIALLFQWGMFSSHDVSICAPVLLISILGLPAFALSGFATRGFHSGRDMKTPVYASYWSFGINFACSLALMFPYGASGLAAANVIAATVQSIILNAKIRIKYGSFSARGEILKIIGAAAVMGVVVVAGRELAYTLAADDVKLAATASCVIVIPIAAAVYFAMLKLLKFRQFDGLVATAKKKLHFGRKSK